MSTSEAPAAYLPFESHADALGALKSVGYYGAEVTPSFTPTELVEAVNKLASPFGKTLLDATSSIPITSAAAYQALTVAGVTAGSSCRNDSNAAVLIMRTAANTPSFLFGEHWGLCQTLGREAAAKHVHDTPAVAGVVFHGDSQFFIPASACHVDEMLCARMIAAEVTGENEFFRCGICFEPFVTKEGGVMKISEVAVTTCSHLFHASCARNFIEKSGVECPTCGGLQSAVCARAEGGETGEEI